MVVCELRLALLPHATTPDTYRVRLWELVDDGMQRQWVEVLPPASQAAAVVIDPTRLDVMAEVRAAPDQLAPANATADLRQRLDELCSWLSTHLLPKFVRQRLADAVRDDHQLRLVIQTTGTAAALPWEDLRIAGSAPLARAQWQIVRQLPDPVDKPPGTSALATDDDLRRPQAPRKALLVVGHVQQPLTTQHVDGQVLRIRTALTDAGFDVELCAGRTAVGSLQVQTTLQGKNFAAILGQRISSGEFALVHYVGHSTNAGHKPGAKTDTKTGTEADAEPPSGRSALTFEIGGHVHPILLSDLAPQFAKGNVRAVVLHACETREAAAECLLREAKVQHVATMAGLVAPALCADWAAAFYGALATRRRFGDAMADARAKLRSDHTFAHLTWLPQHWSRDDSELAFADEDRMVVERYRRALVQRLDRFTGRFSSRSLADVYVEERIHEPAAGSTDKPQPTPLGLPPECTFAVLLHRRPPDGTRAHYLLGGRAGAGKTTALRMQARRLAADCATPKVPIYVPLSTWLAPQHPPHQPRPTLQNYVARRHQAPEHQQARLEELLDALGMDGSLVVLLDGLDELDTAAREVFVETFRELTDRWAKSTFVVSTRRYKFTGSLTGCRDVDVRALDRTRAERLFASVLQADVLQAERWTPTHAADDARRWYAHFATGPETWRDLGGVPLFVTLMAELWLQGKAPVRGRRAFFDSVFAHLCLDQHHGGTLDPDVADAGPRPLVKGDDASERQARVDAVLDVLARLALRMTSSLRIDVPLGEVKDWLAEEKNEVRPLLARAGLPADPLEFLQQIAIRTQILGPNAEADPERAQDPRTLWRFWHRSFQEALTARALRHRVEAGQPVQSLLSGTGLQITPGAAAVVKAREELLKAWRKDFEMSFRLDWDEANVISTAEQLGRMEENLDRAQGRITNTEGLFAAVADLIAPRHAARSLHSFAIEPLALLLDGLVDANAVDRALAIGTELLRQDPGLGRGVTAAMGQPLAALLEGALAATTRTDRDVRDATSDTALYEGLTLRLQDRVPLYRACCGAERDLPALLAMISRRIALADDPGDLLWIDEVLATLPPDADVHGVRTDLWQRFGTPDFHAWHDHFVQIAGGTFQMGSDAGVGIERERPRHAVILSPFWLGKTAITVSLYRQFWPQHRVPVGGTLRQLDELRGVEVAPGEPADELPVTFVSWYAATMLCRWLRRHWPQLVHQVPGWQGLAPALPTEAQAEFAIRGGPGDGSEYWFGGEGSAEAHAWLRTNSENRAHGVGRKPANRLGLLDVTGNVWWWCRDAYGPYPVGGGRRVDPLVHDPSASSRVARGGSFADPVLYLRSAYRDWLLPAYADRDQGVRIALVAAPSELGSDFDLRSLGM